MPSRRKLRVERACRCGTCSATGMTGTLSRWRPSGGRAPLSAPAPLSTGRARRRCAGLATRGGVARARVERQALKRASESAELEYASRVRRAASSSPRRSRSTWRITTASSASRREKERLRGRAPARRAADAPERLNDPCLATVPAPRRGREQPVARRARDERRAQQEEDGRGEREQGRPRRRQEHLRDYGREAELADIAQRQRCRACARAR